MARVGERCDPGVVLEGLLRISIRSDDGRRATLRYIRKGESFGVESLFQPMSHTVMAVTSSSVAHYDRLSTEQLMRRHPVLAVRIAHRLAESIREMDESAVLCAFMNVSQRVVHHLVAMATPGQGGAFAAVSQQELADAVGSVREVVARVIRDLRAQHIIETSRSGISITNELALYRYGAEPSRIQRLQDRRN